MKKFNDDPSNLADAVLVLSGAVLTSAARRFVGILYLGVSAGQR